MSQIQYYYYQNKLELEIIVRIRFFFTLCYGLNVKLLVRNKSIELILKTALTKVTYIHRSVIIHYVCTVHINYIL